MKKKPDKRTEAVSPVIGVILMVAITVILAAVIGTFVLGLGEDVSSTSSAGVQVSEEPGFSVTFTIVDPGNLDGATVVGPDGARSAKATDTVTAGAEVIIQEGGFDNDSINNISSTNRQAIANSLGISLSSVPKNLVGDDECLIRHGEQRVRELPVGGADIGCSAQILNDFIENNLGRGGFAGSDIPYEADAEYQLIGETDGDENVLQSLETSED
jgi:flagellin-like protein